MFSTVVFLCLFLVVRAQYECNQAVFNIDTNEAARLLENCSILTGVVQIDPRNVNGVLHLDSVEKIYGNLIVHTYRDEDGNTTAVEPVPEVELSLSRLHEVTGRFEASETPNLVSMRLPALASVAQMFYIHNLPRLESIVLPELDKVGAFVLDAVPALRTLQIDKGVSEITGFQDTTSYESYATDPYVVVQNTALTKLESFNFSTVAIFQITNNPNLESIVLPVTETTRAASWTLTTNEISGNGNSTTTLSLPRLWKLDTEFTEFHDLARIDVPRLRKIWGNFLIGDNPFLTIFNASKLVEITNELIIEWNPKLSSITFPALRSLTSLIAQGTKAMRQRDGLSMPDLREVKEVYIGGDDSKVNCQLWDSKRCRGIVSKVYSCGSNWRHQRHIRVAKNPEVCKFIHPAYGWTRAKKIWVFVRIAATAAVLTCMLFGCLYYRQTIRSVDYRNVVRQAIAGKYQLAKDEEEDLEFDVRDTRPTEDTRHAERAGAKPSRPKVRFLPEQIKDTSSSAS